MNWEIFNSAKIVIPVIIIVLLIIISILFASNPYSRDNAVKFYYVNGASKDIVFIIPGLGEDEDKFKTIEKNYLDVGITPIFINMDWRITHISHFVSSGSTEIAKAANTYPGSNYYFFGFSFGAVVALSNAGKIRFKGNHLLLIVSSV